ncbi:MAG TPA: ATP-binding protein [Telluria sp.]|jgi:signal transduction histidine kinase
MHCVKTTRFNSLGVKVLLAYVAGVLLSVVLMLAALVVMTTQSDILLSTDVAERAKDMAGELRFDRAGRPAGLGGEHESVAWMFDSLKRELAYRVLDRSGKVLLVSAAGTEALWPATAANHRLQAERFTFTHAGVPMYAATARVEHDGNTVLLQYAASARMMNLLQGGFGFPFMAAGIVAFSLILFFVFGACALITLRYTLKPLRDVSESAAAISTRSLHARLHARTVPAEIAPLVDSFNRVLERLEHGYRVQQGFLATAAHELKTPLALIRAQIELTEPGAERDALLGDVQHMTRQVQQLLMLAEASEAQNYIVAEVEVRHVAVEAASYLRRMADAAQVRLRVHEDGAGLRWQADQAALFTLLKNLLENAIEHAPAGTEVSVAFDTGSLTVRDRGPGVAPEELAHLFVRFWRGAHRRDHGAGLGLAICEEIARAHGWTLSAHRAQPGLLLRLALTDAPGEAKRVPARQAL